MARPKKANKRRPAKRRGRPERTRGQILLRAQIEALERTGHPVMAGIQEMVPGRGPGVVCEKCGFEQPYKLGSRCRRGELPGVRIPCDGEYAVPADRYVVNPDLLTSSGDGSQQAAEEPQGRGAAAPVPARRRPSRPGRR